VAALVVSLMGNARLAAAQDAESLSVEYDGAPSAVVVRFSEASGELAEADAGPVLTVYGDGGATVRYPAYMRRAGTYDARLSRAEVDALVSSLAAKGLVEIDVAAVQRNARAAESARLVAGGTPPAQSVPLIAVTDESTTIVELNLDRYQPAGRRPALIGVSKRVVWHGLRQDVARHPSVRAIADVAAARSELLATMDRVHRAATR
jgi:hypothetical protein